MKKKLTLRRRTRIAEVLAEMGPGASIDAKAAKIARCLGEPCTHGQALSLLAQFGGRRRSVYKGKLRAEVEHERFLKMRAQMAHLYD